MNDTHTIYMDMPPAVKGFVVKMFDDGEDYVTIVLNPRYNREQQLKTYEHELRHLEANDLEGYCDPNIIEKLRHAQIGGAYHE